MLGYVYECALQGVEFAVPGETDLTDEFAMKREETLAQCLEMGGIVFCCGHRVEMVRQLLNVQYVLIYLRFCPVLVLSISVV